MVCHSTAVRSSSFGPESIVSDASDVIQRSSISVIVVYQMPSLRKHFCYGHVRVLQGNFTYCVSSKLHILYVDVETY